jgi:hypothetical protein
LFRDEYLLAVCGSLHPGTAVDLHLLGIVAVSDTYFPGVEPIRTGSAAPAGHGWLPSRRWRAPAASAAASALAKTAKHCHPPRGR